MGDAGTNAYLLQYDSSHGTWPHEGTGEGGKMVRRSCSASRTAARPDRR